MRREAWVPRVGEGYPAFPASTRSFYWIGASALLAFPFRTSSRVWRMYGTRGEEERRVEEGGGRKSVYCPGIGAFSRSTASAVP